MPRFKASFAQANSEHCVCTRIDRSNKLRSSHMPSSLTEQLRHSTPTPSSPHLYFKPWRQRFPSSATKPQIRYCVHSPPRLAFDPAPPPTSPGTHLPPSPHPSPSQLPSPAIPIPIISPSDLGARLRTYSATSSRIWRSSSKGLETFFSIRFVLVGRQLPPGFLERHRLARLCKGSDAERR